MSQAEREHIASLARRLHREVDRGQFTYFEWAPTIDVTVELAATRSVYALPHLAALASDPLCGDVASEAVTSLVVASDPSRLPAADHSARRGRSGPAKPWSRRRRPLRREIKQTTSPVGAAAAAAMSPDGFVREGALRLLWQVDDARRVALNVTLLRTNDWVERISDEACRLVRTHLPTLPDRSVIGSLPLIKRLERDGRIHDADLHDWAIASIRSNRADGLLHGLTHEHLSVRRACLELALMADDELAAAAVDRTLSCADDAVMRTAAARYLLEGGADDATLEGLRCDKVADVRLLAYRQLLAGPDTELIKTALADPARKVRDLGQFRARQTDLVDPRGFYTRAIAGQHADPVAIAGLGEVGVASDAELVLPYVDASRTKVRRAAVASIGQLAPQEHRDMLVRALLDPNSGIARTARRALRSARIQIDAATLHRLFADAKDGHSLKALALAIDLLPRWDQLPARLGVLPRVSPRLRAATVERIDNWAASYGRTWTASPSSAQITLATEAVDLSPHLPEPTRDRVRFLLDRLAR